MAVVTDDAGQRDGAEAFPLSFGEDALLLPPEPSAERATVTFPHRLGEGRRGPGESPVSISQSPKLSGQQTSQKRADAAARQSGLGDGPHPHVDVVRRPVQELERVGQREVV